MKIRYDDLVNNKAVYLADWCACLGSQRRARVVDCADRGRKFWPRVINDVKARDTRDILIAVVDGLTRGRLPQALVKTCIVHPIRYPMQFASWKVRKSISKLLRPIYL